jgi:hypothetical protein
LFHTDALFYPAGADLVLHNHMASSTLAAATIFGRWPVVPAMNLTLLAASAANGLAVHVLCARLTSHWRASAIAGVAFAASPLLSGHLFAGHFTYYHAWAPVTFAIAALAAFEHLSLTRAAIAGGALALVAWTDYYYFVYSVVFLAIVLADRWMNPRVTPRESRRAAVDVGLAVIAVAAAALAIWIARTGGTVLFVGDVRLSLTTGFTVRSIASIAAVIWLLRRLPVRVRLSLVPRRPTRDLLIVAVLLGVAALAMSPLLLAALRVWRAGDYVSQRYMWRNAPGGVDLASLVAFSPSAGPWHEAVGRFYQWRGMDPEGLFFGVGVAWLLVATRRHWMSRSDARLWVVTAVVFAVWSLGPYLQVLGIQTGLPLPQILLRYIPIVSNARSPGYAVVLVHASAAVLLAMGLAAAPLIRSRIKFIAILIGLVAELMPWGLPLTPLDRPALYSALAAQPAGAVMEVPLGIRDGFGARGQIDPKTMYYQTTHQHPITGGYLGRVAPGIVQQYENDPVLATMLRLSGGEELTPADLEQARTAASHLKSLGVRYVVVNDDAASSQVARYVAAMPLRVLMMDGPRRLLVIDD